MRMYDLILKKRNGGALGADEIDYMCKAYLDGQIEDYQMSAFLMAVYFQGMTDRELGDFTMAMARSGDMVDLSSLGSIVVDKHSTGGVGDKTTFILASIVAACGGIVAKMSGRGLGHTGGTVDKMESIPGMRSNLSMEAFIKQVEDIHLSLIGQSADLAPLDKRLYALRDVTGTVESIPLIASSIMSKKLASGSQAILLDVKVGSGAFMKTEADARRLAETMVAIGRHNGRRMQAVLTDMEEPLGRTIGNALEIREVIDVLHNRGPEDLRRECVSMAARMLMLCDKGDYASTYVMAERALADGRALEAFRNMIDYQGGDVAVLEDPSRLPQAAYRYEIKAQESGYIVGLQADACGRASVLLGAGRNRKDDTIDYAAGIEVMAKIGDKVACGDCLAILYTNDPTVFAEAAAVYQAAVSIGSERPFKRPLILGVVE